MNKNLAILNIIPCDMGEDLVVYNGLADVQAHQYKHNSFCDAGDLKNGV